MNNLTNLILYICQILKYKIAVTEILIINSKPTLLKCPVNLVNEIF